MSGIGATLAKPVGPMPLGAWLLVGGGGLFIAWRQSTKGTDDAPAPATDDPLPTGGGLDMEGATGSYDGAPVVLSPIFNVPAPIVNITMPTPLPPPPVVVKPPPVTPRVPVVTRGGTPKPVLHYTVVKGDTLWGIAGRLLGSGTRWTKLYSDNAATIEAAAKKHGHASSTGPTGRGHWIFPGTVLVVKR